MSIILKKEYKMYLEHQDEFISQHLNDYVLIKEEKIVGFFKSYEGALNDGLKHFGNVPFFIRLVKKEEEVHFHQGIS